MSLDLLLELAVKLLLLVFEILPDVLDLLFDFLQFLMEGSLIRWCHALLWHRRNLCFKGHECFTTAPSPVSELVLFPLGLELLGFFELHGVLVHQVLGLFWLGRFITLGAFFPRGALVVAFLGSCSVFGCPLGGLTLGSVFLLLVVFALPGFLVLGLLRVSRCVSVLLISGRISSLLGRSFSGLSLEPVLLFGFLFLSGRCWSSFGVVLAAAFLLILHLLGSVLALLWLLLRSSWSSSTLAISVLLLGWPVFLVLLLRGGLVAISGARWSLCLGRLSLS